jgi:hypothetical protein
MKSACCSLIKMAVRYYQPGLGSGRKGCLLSPKKMYCADSRKVLNLGSKLVKAMELSSS